jgi:Peptidase family M23
LLILKTLARRLVLPCLVCLAWAPAAQAWSWPVQGPVLRAFSYDESTPYAAGQHRGVDIGADAAGDSVVAPASGTISFAGTVPTSGKSVTIQTSDGYAVTLTHLGSIAVVKGATVHEQDPVGSIGPSGTPEVDGPYVHLGIRVATDPNGYVDPLGLLPPPAEGDPGQSDSPASQPSPGVTTSTVPASEPAPSAPAGSSVATTAGSTVTHEQGDGSGHRHEHAQGQRTNARPRQSSQRPAVPDTHSPRVTSTARVRSNRPTSSSRRPVVETAAPVEPSGLDAGHEIRSSKPAAQPAQPSAPPSRALLPLLCNGVAALVALGAALAAGGRRRRRLGTSPITAAQVLELPRRQRAHQRAA